MEQNQPKITTPDTTQLDGRLLGLVEKYAARVTPDRFAIGAYIIQFFFGGGNIFVTLKILFSDKSGSDVVITNMTTLPPERKGEGGSEALKKIIEWSRENVFNEIRATQVQDKDSEFWIKNGFVKDKKSSQTKDYILKLN